MPRRPLAWLCFFLLPAAVVLPDLRAEQIGRAVHRGDTGALIYEEDDLGNRLPDFSAAGYAGGGVPLPVVDARVRVAPGAGDDTARIQAAIDYVASLPADDDGFRGAVALEAGEFRVYGQLRISASGVVLRGQGNGGDGSVIVAAGTDRRTLIVVRGTGDAVTGESVAVADDYVPVGGLWITPDSTADFSVGDRVRIDRPSPKEWIEAVGMHISPARTHYRWREGRIDLSWDRTVTEVADGRLRLDAPLTTALEARFGGATVVRVEDPGRIARVGIERLRLVSEYDTRYPMDEEHAWMGIQMDHVEDAWVADVTGRHFVSSLVDLGPGARAVTVQDCRSLEPVSENGGYRRHTFHTRGQRTLFLRCRAEQGRHDFTVGYLATGPNVFLDCEAVESTGTSGSIGSWASGALFDNVIIDGGDLALDNMEIRYGGVGWAAGNSALWQCEASRIICRSPPGTLNWAIGVWGKFIGEGRWQRSNEIFEPRSLYEAQLEERLGTDAVAALEKRAYSPRGDANAPALEDVVDASAWRSGADAPAITGGLRIENGWLVDDNGLVSGGTSPMQWWRGHLLPTCTGDYDPHLTRFLPGRIGPGATEDFAELLQRMRANNHAVMRHHWGLWYDRRREDHQMVRRATNEVWPPFYEMPWARSGEGRAWDGLSKFDLERFNPWYFSRLREFAAVARGEGRVLVNEMYFQHNILEAGAHWADFPWRPVNAVQDTGFREPPEYAGGKRVFKADDFYDVEHPVRRELHRKYIRKCLDNLAGEPNVIHTTSEEYSGPLHFVEFWLDVVEEWMEETGHRPLIGLSAPKDVQDAILGDPRRADFVDVIEFKYWWDSTDGQYAPDGGQSLAPRQHLRQWRGARPSTDDVAKMIEEYRFRFPEKAILAGALPGGHDPWRVLAAGGSIPELPSALDPALRAALPSMRPMHGNGGQGDFFVLGDEDGRRLVYALSGSSPRVDLSGHRGSFERRAVDPATGRLGPARETIQGGGTARVARSVREPSLFWISR
ncbi:MAG: hypothetical protein JJU00_00090 [Opitutales bacterium]|nr:hypothetical protein [Opitutales bacterium]